MDSPIHNFGCDLSHQQSLDLLELGLKEDTLAAESCIQLPDKRLVSGLETGSEAGSRLPEKHQKAIIKKMT